MKILSQRETVTEHTYNRVFEWRDHRGAGYGFTCDAHGNIDPAITECARDALRKCLDGTYDVVDLGIVQYTHTWHKPAIGLCDCGEDIALDGFTNTCECGRDYNMSGSLLADRSQWGEETGESLDDILSIP